MDFFARTVFYANNLISRGLLSTILKFLLGWILSGTILIGIYFLLNAINTHLSTYENMVVYQVVLFSSLTIISMACLVLTFKSITRKQNKPPSFDAENMNTYVTFFLDGFTKGLQAKDDQKSTSKTDAFKIENYFD